ncbi:hypothetical protein HYW76_03005 [Candidatus Pacearchaeota archaeon]|nr:hypothetical protein [Candidatus Pacearchaeota archaeon]
MKKRVKKSYNIYYGIIIGVVLILSVAGFFLFQNNISGMVTSSGEYVEDSFIQSALILELPEIHNYFFHSREYFPEEGRYNLNIRYNQEEGYSQKSEFLIYIYSNPLDSSEMNSWANIPPFNFAIKTINGNKILEGSSTTSSGLVQRQVSWISNNVKITGWNGDDEGLIVDNNLFDALTIAYLEKYPSTYNPSSSTNSQSQKNCIDSDPKDGMIKYKGKTYENKCSGVKLTEYYCDSKGKKKSRKIYCDNGYCDEGRCVQANFDLTNLKCYDEDNKNEFNAGKTFKISHPSRKGFYISKVYEDSCLKNGKLQEYYCDSKGRVKNQKITCENECKDGRCVIPNEELSVAAIKISLKEFSLARIEEKITNLMSNHPNTDLIITPEYLLFGAGFYGVDYRNDPVIVNCHNNLCNINSIGTQKSNEIIEILDRLKNIARENNINMVFGTIAERVVVDQNNFVVDTQLIIDKNGNIIGKHAKYDVVYSSEVSCDDNPSLCQNVRDLNLETARTFILKDKENSDFEILPLICGEKITQEYIDRLVNKNAYLVVGSDFDVDFNYEAITQNIQNGNNPFENPIPNSGDALLKDIFLNRWINNKVIKQDSYLLAADSGIPTAGIVSWNMNKIKDLDITNDYTYGKITIEK